MIPPKNPHYWDQLKLVRSLSARYDLDTFDLEIIRFIFERTRAWNKAEEFIPRKHFLEGVWQLREGEVRCIQGPVPMSEDTLYRRLTQLQSLGLIAYEEQPEGRKYSLNLEDMPKLRVPKRLQKFAKPTSPSEEEGKTENTAPALSGGVTRPERVGHPPLAGSIEDEKRTGESEEEKAAPPGVGGESRELAKARMEVRGVRTRRAEKRSSLLTQKHLRHTDLCRLWMEEISARFPDRPLPLTEKERCALYQKQKQFNASARKATFGEVVAWGLDNWAAVLHLHFGWMKNKPDSTLPEPWFFIRQFTKFEALFSRRVGHDWVRHTDGFQEDDELSQRLAAGQSFEEAKLAMRDGRDRRQSEGRVNSARKDIAALVASLERMTPQEISAARTTARARYREVLNNSVEEW